MKMEETKIITPAEAKARKISETERWASECIKRINCDIMQRYPATDTAFDILIDFQYELIYESYIKNKIEEHWEIIQSHFVREPFNGIVITIKAKTN